jgi:serine/threonine-protein kinase
VHPDLWARVAPLLDELLEFEPELRTTRLDAIEHDDPDVARELRRLLALESARPDFLAISVSDTNLHAPKPGARIGPYKLLRSIGEGGMGQVWLAERADGLFERRVALKLLRPGFADSGLRSRFDRERQILASLGHEHVARLLDAGFGLDGQPYLALEFVEGQNITEYSAQRKLTVVQKLQLFLQVCSAVSHAHASLVVHRDLKPSNIMVTPGGAVRLLDFGIAKLLDAPGKDTASETTRAGTRAFTLHYAAPEQIRGEQVTTATDVYSLGVVLYELLTGCKPYKLKRETDAEWEEAILNGDPTRPSSMTRGRADLVTRSERRLSRVLSGDLDNITLKALQKLPEARYRSVEAMAADIRRYLNGRPVEAHAQSYGYRLGKYIHRNAVQIAAVFAVIALLGGALFIMWSQQREANAAALRAQSMHDFVVGLFEQAEKQAGASNAVDIRSLLDAGVRRSNAEFANQPITRTELLALIARMRLRLGDYQAAIAVLDQQPRLADAPDDVQAESLQLRGEALRKLGQPARCRDLLVAHLDLLDGREEAAKLKAADYRSVLGRCERGLMNTSAARTDFQRALAIRSALGDAKEAEAESLFDLATLESDTGHGKAAMAGMLDALQRLRVAHDEQGPLAIQIWLNLGNLYREAGNGAAAENAFRTDLRLATSLYGTGHPDTIDAERGLAAIYVDQGKLNEAEKLFAQAEAQLTRLLGANHPDLGSMSNSLGIIAWQRGDLVTAEARLRRAVELWTPTQRLQAGVFNLAMVLHDAGRDDDAQPLAERALALRERQFGSHSGAVGNSLRQLGEIALGRHDETAAEKYFQQALDALRGDYGAAHTATGQAQLAVARLRIAQQRPTDAQALVDDVLHRFLPSDAEHRRLLWSARALIAQMQCTQPASAAQGRSALQKIHSEIVAEMPVGVDERSAAAALRACGG